MSGPNDALDALSVLAAAGALDSTGQLRGNIGGASNASLPGPPEPGGDDGTGSGEPRGCTCKASRCLKLYCVCFAANRLCGRDCSCRSCHNNGQFPEHRKAAIEAVLERNPSAFQPKINDRARHTKGCSCRKSGCLKRYCECFNAGVLCTDLCKCITCKNFEGSADLACGLAPGVGGVMRKHNPADHNHVHHTKHQPHSHASAAHHCADHCDPDPHHAAPPRPHVHTLNNSHTALPGRGEHAVGFASSSATPGSILPHANCRPPSSPPVGRHSHACDSAAPVSRKAAIFASGAHSFTAAKGDIRNGRASSVSNCSGSAPGGDSRRDSGVAPTCPREPKCPTAEKMTKCAGGSSTAGPRNSVLLRCGKRVSTHRELATQPPAKRVLFQRGPAFKSRFGEIGSPGGLHYQTNAVDEDRPENMRDAASKALHPSVVSAAEKDTATFLAMFSQRAAGLPLRKSASLRGSWDAADNTAGASGQGQRSMADRAVSPRAGVKADDLYCEEPDLGQDDDVDQLTKLGQAAGLDPGAIAALGTHPVPGSFGHRGEETDGNRESDSYEGKHVPGDSGKSANPDDNERSQGDAENESGSRIEEKVRPKGAVPKPPWYVSAERHALEHCAAVLRRIANTPPSPVVSGPQRRRKLSGATSRFYDNPYSTAAGASASRAHGVAPTASPPAPRS